MQDTQKDQKKQRKPENGGIMNELKKHAFFIQKKLGGVLWDVPYGQKKHWQINPYDSGSIYFSGCKE